MSIPAIPMSPALPVQYLDIPSGDGGVVRAMFQSMDAGEGRAEVEPFSPDDAEGGPQGLGVGSMGGSVLSLSLGWAWLIGQRPVCKTRRVIGAADGTCFFALSTAAIDRFYYVGPSTSRVLLSPAPAIPGRAPVVIDAAHPYAECAGTVVTSRGLSQASAADREFMSIFASAKAAAVAAGMIE